MMEFPPRVMEWTSVKPEGEPERPAIITRPVEAGDRERREKIRAMFQAYRSSDHETADALREELSQLTKLEREWMA